MPVMVCPACGSEYISSVAVCPDDGTLLVESQADEMEATVASEVAIADERAVAELDPDGADGEEGLGDEEAAGDEGDDEIAPGTQIAYELDDWDGASRALLDQLLTGEGIVHVWEAGTMVIRAEDEDRTDVLVEQVEVSQQPTLDADKEQVVYELDGWPDEKVDALAESLADATVPFGFDENGDLVVHEEDEERVEPIIDQVDMNYSLSADDIMGSDSDDPEDEADGLKVQDALSDLFVGADRLLHDVKDANGIATLVRGDDIVRVVRLPYGFARGAWNDILGRAAELRALVAPTPLDGTADEDRLTDDELDDTLVDDQPDDAPTDGGDDEPADDEATDEQGDEDDVDAFDEEEAASPEDLVRTAARTLRELLRQYV